MKTGIKLSKKDLGAFFLCFSFVPVYAIQAIIGTNGYVLLMAVSCLYITAVTIKDKTILQSRLFCIWMVLFAWMTICTIVNSESIINPIYYVGKVAFWFLINDTYIKRGSLRLLKVSRIYVGIIIALTLIQQIVAPGVYGYADSGNARNVFTSDNFLGYYYVAYIALCFILDFAEKGKTRARTYLMMFVCFASICVAWAVKNVIGIGLIILYIIFCYKKKISRVLRPSVLIIAFILIFVGIAFFNVQSIFSDFFYKYFGKSGSVSVRYYIWTQAIKNVKASPMFGYGIPEGGRMILQQSFAGNARSSHNVIFELLLAGGFIGLGIYVASIISALYSKASRLKGKYEYEYLFLLFIIFMFFVMQLASGSVYYPFYYMPLILIMNLEKIVEIKENSLRNGKQESMYRYKL